MLKLFRIILTTILVVVGTPVFIWVGGYALFATAVITMKEPDSTVKADAAIVLTGGTGRVSRGLDLLADGRVESLLISGVYKGTTRKDILRQWNRPEKNKKELPNCCLTLGYEAGNTVGNATEAHEWLKDNKAATVFVVTANYHMLRSLLELRHAEPKVNFIPFPVKPDKLDPDQEAFWRLVFREYNKLVISLIRVMVFPSENSPVPQALAS